MMWLGWLGSVMLACCGIPQAILTLKRKNADGVSWGMLLLWYFGEILTMLYVLPTWNLPLLFNYVINILAISIIIWYKIYPKEQIK